MNILKGRTSKAVVFALAVVIQLYVSGGFALAAPDISGVAAKPVARQEVQGRLTTSGDNPVSVNGNNAKTGETIFSGQQIQTPAGTSATVELPGLGSVEIAPGSNITLTFSAGKISVVVISGCVTLRASDGVTGTVQSGGRTRTTGADGGTIDTCHNVPGAIPPGTTAGVGSLGTGTSLALTAAIVGTFAIISHELISDSNNPIVTPTCTPIPGTTSPLTPPSGCAP